MKNPASKCFQVQSRSASVEEESPESAGARNGLGQAGLRPGGGKGFSLIEVVLALGLGVFALVAIVGLLPTGISSMRDSLELTEATQIANAIACDLRTSAQNANPLLSATSAIYGIPLQTGTYKPFVDVSGTLAKSSARFRAQVVVTANAMSPGYFAPSNTIAPVTHAAILIAWPAAAEIENSVGRLEIASSFTAGKH